MSTKMTIPARPSAKAGAHVIYPDGVPHPPAPAPERLTMPGRRRFLGAGATLAGATLAGAGALRAEPLPVPKSNLVMGDPIPETDYGMPISFEDHVRRHRTDVFVNRQNWSDWSMSPLQHQNGIITPNGLFFERHHNGIAKIDPEQHRLAIHGMVRQPLLFSMDDILRYPSVSKFHFMECSGNGLTDWAEPRSTTVQQSHGLLSCAQWTGVPLSWLLDEAGVTEGAKWVVFEGGDGSGHLRSIPIEKVMDDALLLYGQNGEMLRAEQGYPMRAFFPGWEGNTCVKWLRRIYVTDEPLQIRGETARYTDPMPGGKWRQFSMEMECKSVITSPSGGMQLNGPGLYEIRGFAWSGLGTITHVDITLDGGRTWTEATLEDPVLDKCLTRFRYRWNWDGGPARIASRAQDSTGYVQPTAAQLAEVREIVGFVQHNNAIFPWAVDENGGITNAIA
ncbi:MAG: sulfite dehydrogenase [Paracoccus sp. (in: a-proteobacteria)]|uniref:sulfite dehydrogenase n=1 Tax=Paracoccus sp. TaxID=267 RepID=UPI0026DFF6CA|nr:sulfite dehydrogenase [Paracoccus sp. (in: a-proteobacteria)]MDO5630219.1 sulfite dehydrogenase [Paracoccus sp. (in: a-proteobacteria)]